MTLFFLAVIAIHVALTPVTAAGTVEGGAIADTVVLDIAEPGDQVVLGEWIDASITVTNTGAALSPPLVVHIDITDPSGDGSVDPEDWTATLSKPIGQLDGGEQRALHWRLQPISGGSFTLYAVALSGGVDNLSASNAVTIDVADQRSLNPNGILPVAIGTPTVIGALLIAQRRRSRRRPAPGIGTL